MSDNIKLAVITSILIAIIFILWITSPMLLELVYPEQTEKIATLFDPISSLFGGLAFLGVIITILLQRQELIAQRHELKLTRMVHEESTKLMEESTSVQLNSNLTQSLNLLIEHKKNEIEHLKKHMTHQNSSRIKELEKEIDTLIGKLEFLTISLESYV